MPRIAIISVAGAFWLGACSHSPEAWKRTDGAPIANDAIAAAKTACKGEAAKANLSAGREAALAPDILGWSGGMQTVYNGCMAEHGYLAARD